MDVLLCLVLAAAPDIATLPLAPAPGAPPAPGIVVFGNTAPLDAEGRGTISSEGSPAAEGLRFYRTAPDSSGRARAYYYPASSALASWKLAGVETSARATIVIKDAAVTWNSARSFTAPLETVDGGRRVRFAVSPGTWDVAVVVPGFAPGFVSELDVYADDETLNVSAVQLDRAGRVTARVLDARTGKPPDRWEAYVSGVGADPEDVEAKFFDGWPIPSVGAALDFASLPVGSWEVRVVAPGRSGPRVAATVLKAQTLVDLGDVYVTHFGKLRVVLEFPGDVPPGTFEVTISRPRDEFEGEPIVLATRKGKARGDLVFDFEGIEPGPVHVAFGNADARIWRQTETNVEAERTAEARLVVRRVKLHGVVLRGEERVSGVQVGVSSGKPEWDAEPEISDELGSYTLETWGGDETIVLSTRPAGQKIGFFEFVKVDAGAIEVVHDVLLPDAEIRGVVRDAETGLPVAEAEVTISPSVPANGPPDPEESVSYVLPVQSDADGRFRLANLEKDEAVDVVVSHPDYSPARIPSVTPRPGGAEVEARLERGMRVSGTVRDESGGPVAGVAVGLDAGPRGVEFERTTTTAADGRFEFSGVGTGTHLLGILECGRTIVLRQFRVARPVDRPDATQDEDIQLAGEHAPVTVTFENADGSGAAGAPLRWAIDGLALPHFTWSTFARRCGTEFLPNGIVLHGFPRGTITALSLWSQLVFGTFQNDGTQTDWKIRLPAAETGKEAEAGPQAAR